MLWMALRGWLLLAGDFMRNTYGGLFLLISLLAVVLPRWVSGAEICQALAWENNYKTLLQQLFNRRFNTATSTELAEPEAQEQKWEREWPDAVADCLPELQHLAGFGCFEMGTEQQYFLYYRKALIAAIDLSELSLARAAVLCGHDNFYWADTRLEYGQLWPPYRDIEQQLTAVTVELLCSLDHGHEPSS